MFFVIISKFRAVILFRIKCNLYEMKIHVLLIILEEKMFKVC